MTAELVE